MRRGPLPSVCLYISDELKTTIYLMSKKNAIPIYKMGMEAGFPANGIIYRILNGYPLGERYQQKLIKLAQNIGYNGEIFQPYTTGGGEK